LRQEKWQQEETGVDPGVPCHFTLKFVVNFKDVFKFRTFHGQFQSFFTNKRVCALLALRKSTLQVCLESNTVPVKKLSEACGAAGIVYSILRDETES
jgi:hypothetical protein